MIRRIALSIAAQAVVFATLAASAHDVPDRNPEHVQEAVSGDTLLMTSRIPVSASDQDHFREIHWFVRLTGIAAPKTSMGPCNLQQPFAEQARRRLQELAGEGKVVMKKCVPPYRNSVFVCEVFGREGRLSEQLVKEGLAWSTAKDPVLDKLQEEARAARLGLWQDPAAIAPADWVNTHWPKRSPRSAATCK